ncbi:alpha-N-acetylglucosaminidase TIM-barrel domain-containing protein [Amnibacterium sp. CER49]|uniref:alpha-N-acetylglucosaminidase TIM-barrel domain-containing protein n=1 Tax=Amnibacterium sp. CER49 TaxID=3039161 RepID=UPI002449B10C|nr:alpha-N-acetylglucosaminidase TIM-barrel domain-containing protein [Amnibacterium sp. CER49]MDH2442585.1 alpha-N-acetylglucosaminidase TIM-barrel domain-containing protein [Amnibacterium sp. CER49]
MEGQAEVAEGYYFNFCTFSYTVAYWDWDKWEREVDWMALNGITMPLNVLGHESVLHRVYTEVGLNDEEVRAFLGGPGYLPFQYMGCLDSFAGPLPTSWIRKHEELAVRVLDRQRSLGMTPVLPAFTGHVPAQLAGPTTGTRTWDEFTTHVLHPADPRYAELCRRITEIQMQTFGSDHLYAADPFIEMIPVDADPAHPGRVARATISGLVAADPQAVWVLQSWPFSFQDDFWTEDRVASFLDAMPAEHSLILDLWAETKPMWNRSDRFRGKPWVWCALLNFGGRTDLIGNLSTVADGFHESLTGDNPPIGWGLAMEGTRNNTALFQRVAEAAWSGPAPFDHWLRDFVRHRYAGAESEDLVDAWRALASSVYKETSLDVLTGHFRGALTAKPSYAETLAPDRLATRLWGSRPYDPAILVRAWRLLIEEAERRPRLLDGELGHDLIEVGRVVLSHVVDQHLVATVREAARSSGETPEALGRFLAVFDDLDRLLACRPEFTLEHWVGEAEAWAEDEEERRILRDNARRIVTVWDRPGPPNLDDYAARTWSGLVGGYYKDRWTAWARGLFEAVRSPSAEHDQRLGERLLDIERTFLERGPDAQPRPTTDVASLARRLFEAHAGALRTSTDVASQTVTGSR